MRPLWLVLSSSVVGCSLLVDTSGLAGFVTDGTGGALDGGGSDALAGGDGGTQETGSLVDAGACEAQNDPTLVLYFPFDDDGPGAHDCSGHGHDAKPLGAAPGRAMGKKGRAATFNGVQTCLDLGRPTDLVAAMGGPFTVAAWASVTEYAQSGGNARSLFASTTDTSSRGFRVVTDEPTVFGVKLGTPSGAVSVLTTSGQPTLTWIHFVVVWVPGVRGTAYSNTSSVSLDSGVVAMTQDPNAPFLVGCNQASGGVFSGAIDDLRVYARALEPAEIAKLAE